MEEKEEKEKEPTRTQRFERDMTGLPNELVDSIAEYIREPGNEQIAKTNHWSRAVEQSYNGLKDGRYNTLPDYQKDLAVKIAKYGSFEMVKYTLDRWYSTDIDQNWDKFIKDYPYGHGINPHSIKKILEQEHKWAYIGNQDGGIRLKKMRTKRRIFKKHNTKKRISKKRISKK
jgi:hypothetical protein